MSNPNDLSSLLSISDHPVQVGLENPLTLEPLVGPDGNPATLSVWGPHSAVMRAVEKEISTEMMDAAMKSRGRGLKLDNDKFTRKRFLARIDGWSNLTLGDDLFPYTAENKARVYDDPVFGPVREMFETAMADTSAFLVGKQTSKT